jgi:hypothetical protein
MNRDVSLTRLKAPLERVAWSGIPQIHQNHDYL